MSLFIDFKKNMPDEKNIVWVEYYKINGSPEECVIDVFIDNMKIVKYTLQVKTLTSTVKTLKAVAILSVSSGFNVLIGVSIRKPGDPVSSTPKKKHRYYDYSFKQDPNIISEKNN